MSFTTTSIYEHTMGWAATQGSQFPISISTQLIIDLYMGQHILQRALWWFQPTSIHLARSYPYDRARPRRKRLTGSGNPIPWSVCVRVRSISQCINDTIDDIFYNFNLQVYTGLGSDVVPDQGSQFPISISAQLITNFLHRAHILHWALRRLRPTSIH
jgi:hypothetical protein